LNELNVQATNAFVSLSNRLSHLNRSPSEIEGILNKFVDQTKDFMNRIVDMLPSPQTMIKKNDTTAGQKDDKINRNATVFKTYEPKPTVNHLSYLIPLCVTFILLFVLFAGLFIYRYIAFRRLLQSLPTERIQINDLELAVQNNDLRNNRKAVNFENSSEGIYHEILSSKNNVISTQSNSYIQIT